MTTIKNFSPYKIVKKAMENLKPNEVKVIAGRFGIDEDRKTLSSIGKELNLSRERIRQIEKEGLKKLASKIVDRKNIPWCNNSMIPIPAKVQAHTIPKCRNLTLDLIFENAIAEARTGKIIIPCCFAKKTTTLSTDKPRVI